MKKGEGNAFCVEIFPLKMCRRVDKLNMTALVFKENQLYDSKNAVFHNSLPT